MNKVLIALLAGVAVGILVAPDKGSATRAKLTDGFNDLADKLSDLKEKFTPDENEFVGDQPDYTPKMSGNL